jgi:hypothetical protein
VSSISIWQAPAEVQQVGQRPHAVGPAPVEHCPLRQLPPLAVQS